ncbi:hypothetical protein [Maritimibacter alkaliphilus]|uniref:hypothetical protein n=1 Tax=Maritimibacter alkaliphilus TaxID=404236 RepID=UPI0028F7315D|nr:hypothetical protein [Maritimibacter alkaliphilus]
MKSRQTVFLERQSYRLRRRGDAMRFLPVLGIILMLLPLLWTEGPEGLPVSRAMFYIFGVWAGLAVTAGLLSRGQAGARSAALPADGVLETLPGSRQAWVMEDDLAGPFVPSSIVPMDADTTPAEAYGLREGMSPAGGGGAGQGGSGQGGSGLEASGLDISAGDASTKGRPGTSGPEEDGR